ncbi:hypothetical protein GQ44DRAFT_831272 [Phaeosphaeriaceae sp. PMI808]|nr:hypothetical protein GQ44DRAFT_831272 [Phaeosphaeriaceae sp. PMI808]
MLPVVLIVALVFFPLIVGGCIAGAALTSYRRRLLANDLERGYITHGAQDLNNQSITITDSSPPRDRHQKTLPKTPQDMSHSSVELPPNSLHKSHNLNKGKGGGFSGYFTLAMSKLKDKGQTSKPCRPFKNVGLHGGPKWAEKKAKLERPEQQPCQMSINIPVSQPTDTHSNHGASSSLKYGVQSTATGVNHADQDVNSAANLAALWTEDFEDIDIETFTNQTTVAELPATPVIRYTHKPEALDMSIDIGEDGNESPR